MVYVILRISQVHGQMKRVRSILQQYAGATFVVADRAVDRSPLRVT